MAVSVTSTLKCREKQRVKTGGIHTDQNIISMCVSETVKRQGIQYP